MRNKVQLVASIDSAVDERIRELAEREERPVSYFVNNALLQALRMQDAAANESLTAGKVSAA